MITLTAYHEAGVFAALAVEWEALAERSVVNTPFQRVAFQAAWWRHFGEGALCVLAARTEDGVLVGLAPMFVDSAGVLRWVGGEEIADYLDIIASDECMAAVRGVVFDWWLRGDSPHHTRAQLSNMPGWTDTARDWQARAQAAGLTATVEQIDVCPVVTLAPTFDDYLAGIDKKQRHEIRRKLRRAEEFGQPVRLKVLGPEDNIADGTAEFTRLMELSGEHKAQFLTPVMRAAFADIFAATHASGMLKLAFLMVGDEAIAAYVNFDVGGQVWVYNSGIDLTHEARSVSPGWVLLALLIEQAINEGHTHYDFMQGNEDYKYRFGGVDTPVYRLTIER